MVRNGIIKFAFLSVKPHIRFNGQQLHAGRIDRHGKGQRIVFIGFAVSSAGET